jgi:hypothetical protein
MSNLYRVLKKITSGMSLDAPADLMSYYGLVLKPDFIVTHDFSVYEGKSDKEIRSLLLKLNVLQIQALISVFKDMENDNATV